VAENLARLGLLVQLIGVTGADDFGANLLEAARRVGMDVSACEVLPGQRTGTYVSMHGPDGDMAWAVNDMEIIQHLTPERLQAYRHILVNADAVMLDCNLPASSLQWFLETQAHLPNFVDAVSVAKCVRLRPLLAGIHTLKVNALEAAALTGREVASVPMAMAAASALADAGVKQVVLTLGDQGVVWRDAMGACGHAQPRPVVVVNATGAGDALLAGVIWGLSSGYSLGQAVESGLICAEITLQSPHANAPELHPSMLVARSAGLVPLR